MRGFTEPETEPLKKEEVIALIPDINNVNLAVINRGRGFDLCDPLLLVTAEGVLEKRRVQKLCDHL